MSRGHVTVREQFRQAAAGAVARPTRLLLTTVGIVLGVGALVATVGVSGTAAAQVSRQFDAIAATHVAVRPAVTESPILAGLDWLPIDAAERASRLTGVLAAGTLTRLTDPGPVAALALDDPTLTADPTMPVFAVSPGAFEAVSAVIAAGRWFDAGHAARADPVLVLGSRAAERLGITGIEHQPAVWIGGRPFAVLGIVSEAARHTELVDSVAIPEPTAAAWFGWQGPSDLALRTAAGAAGVVAHQAPIALSPNAPELVDAAAPPPPDRLRRAVQGDVDALFLVLGGVTTLAGAVGIANVMLLAVLERSSEIGLRRALGARRRDIGVQFVGESALVGALGGLIGGTGGLLVTVGTAAQRDWAPVLDLRVVAAAPLAGVAVGVLAGLFPAWRAARIEPVAALRGH